MAKQRRGTSRTTRKRESKPDRSSAPSPSNRPPQPVTPPAPPPRPSYLEAVALYERGLEALQRHDFASAAGLFDRLIDAHPDERELLDRARLFLRVCERQTGAPAPPPKTVEERVYAATLAINAGAYGEALDELGRLEAEAPDNDHIHYMFAVAHALRREPADAIRRLRRAIELNTENRSLAKQEPDFDPIRETDEFRHVLETSSPSRRRPRGRSSR